MGVHVVPHLAQTLALGEQHDQPLDRRRERGQVRAPPRLRQERDQLGVASQEVELGLESATQPIERTACG